ncbi:MAG TPA: SIS domain-containing protein [Mycobacteriales bacterium]|nr:SIS domain-containing protein [Mycobacteriales bacterium]
MTARGVEALYPYLYDQPTDRAALRDQVRRSIVAKSAEIVALRDEVIAREGDRLRACAQAMAQRIARGGRLFAFGNGGSSTDALAAASSFRAPPRGRAVAAHTLTADVAALTALANDVGFEVVFARQLAALAGPDDIALALSTSGGSTNVLRGLVQARRLGMLTVGLAGYDGGAMAASDLLDHLFVVPSSSVHRIQEAQTTVYHLLGELVRVALDSPEPG